MAQHPPKKSYARFHTRLAVSGRFSDSATFANNDRNQVDPLRLLFGFYSLLRFRSIRAVSSTFGPGAGRKRAFLRLFGHFLATFWPLLQKLSANVSKNVRFVFGKQQFKTGFVKGLSSYSLLWGWSYNL